MIVDECVGGTRILPLSQSRLRPRLSSHGLYIEPAPRAIEYIILRQHEKSKPFFSVT
jgi:hypothetical protein